jgi:hypothetical protein
MTMLETVRVELPDGQACWARIDTGQAPRDVSLAGRAFKLNGLHEAVQGLAANLRSAMQGLAPEHVSVEFGLELALESSGLVAAVVGIHTASAVKVTLSWTDVGTGRVGSDADPAGA